MRPRLVYNRYSDHGVSVCQPNQAIIRGMCHGGLWSWGHGGMRGFVETQTERQIADGIDRDTARRFSLAMAFGGCTTAESLDLIRDRDCRDGYAVELWDITDVPHDRWFRDAWRRSRNGGPISIDLRLARPIQWKRARDAVEKENKKRAASLDILSPVEVDWERFRERIKGASDEMGLRMIWPKFQ